MKILVVGSGGREHALAWRLAQAPGLQKVYVAPGNAGTAREQESSKDFAKRFMTRHKIPTAKFQTFAEIKAAHAYIDAEGAPIVVKADGLAAGKGVVVAMDLAEAHAAVDMMLADNKLGDAARKPASSSWPMAATRWRWPPARTTSA